MLRHLVFLDIKKTPGATASISSSLEALSKKIPGCLQFHFDECAGGKLSHYFFMDFENEAARDHYVEHPEHKQVAEKVIIPQLQDGLKSVVIFDYAFKGPKKISSMAKGLAAYIFVKNEQSAATLSELTSYCDQIERLKPLQNCSVETLGKEYPFALEVQLKSGNQPFRLSQTPSFWVLQGRSSQSQVSSLNLKSRL